MVEHLIMVLVYWHFLLDCLTSGWTDLPGVTLLCAGWSFSQQACGCILGEGTAAKLTKVCKQHNWA